MSRIQPVVRAATWAADERHIRSVRRSVFVLEQAVPEDLDFDGTDPACYHALAFYQDQAVATGRMTPDGHIGRIAVLRAWRNRGIGSALVLFLVAMARHQALDRVYLNAQKQAVSFYGKLGFIENGAAFMEAGIEHIRMQWTERGR